MQRFSKVGRIVDEALTSNFDAASLRIYLQEKIGAGTYG
jgi:hypothetical protein